MKFIYITILSLAILACKSNTEEKNIAESTDTVTSVAQSTDTVVSENNNSGSEAVTETPENASTNKKVKLPFDFQKYMDKCYLEENHACKDQFPFYKATDLPVVTSAINGKINKNNPDRIYCIDNGGKGFDTFVFNIRDENEDYLQKFFIINVKNNKIISSQEIGQSIDGEAPEDADVTDRTFIINNDLTVSVFDKIFKSKNKLYKSYKINPDGLIVVK